MSRTRCSRRGFTLTEILIVIAILAITAAATLPFIGQFQQSQSQQSLAEDVQHALIRAQSRAMTGNQAVRWGVRFLSGSYVLYAGQSYATRLAGRDENHAVDGLMTFGGQREFTFIGTYGRPTLSGSLLFSHPTAGTERIDVNGHGGIFLAP